MNNGLYYRFRITDFDNLIQTLREKYKRKKINRINKIAYGDLENERDYNIEEMNNSYFFSSFRFKDLDENENLGESRTWIFIKENEFDWFSIIFQGVDIDKKDLKNILNIQLVYVKKNKKWWNYFKFLNSLNNTKKYSFSKWQNYS